MRVGLAISGEDRLASLDHVGRSVWEALAAGHEVVPWPQRSEFSRPRERRAVVDAFVREADVIVGYLNDLVLESRDRQGLDVPCVFHLLGGLPRGAFGWRHRFPQLTTRDVLIANSTADETLAGLLLENATVRRMPFPVDEGFTPLALAEREWARRALGFGADDRLILYAGRLTPEKNLHTLLRTYRAVLAAVPSAHLLVVGGAEDVPFHEFGVRPLHYARSLERAVARLGIPDGRVHLAGSAPPSRLRLLYGMADVACNLTLHHDENFGLAQVEAMACGTPVVGSAWGGLRDTIADGEVGYQVSAEITAAGVKVHWWEAAARVAALLQDAAARDRLGAAGPARVAAHYSATAYQACWDAVLAEAVAGRGETRESLRSTAFAEDFWAACTPEDDDRAPYAPEARGEAAFMRYRSFIAPYAGTTAAAVPVDAGFTAEYVYSLATAVVASADGTLEVNDPLYPLRLAVPELWRAGVATVLAAFTREPAMTGARLAAKVPGADALDGPLGWLVAAGLVLRSYPTGGPLSAADVPSELAVPLFTFCRVDRASTDFLVY